MAILRRLYNWVALKDDVAPAAAGSAKVPTAKRSLGDKGEEHALALLKKRGDKLVARNWSCKSGELDLVTWHGDTLVFTEVRTRSGTEFGTPAESVTPQKQERIRRAAHGFLARNYKDGRLPSCRYDVVWIVSNKNGKIVDSGIMEGAFV